MKWRIEIQITERMEGGYQRLGKTFRRRRTTRRAAENFARDTRSYGFRRRLKDRTEFYPKQRIWMVTVKEAD